MGNRAAACLSGRDWGSAGTGQSGLAVFGSLFGGTAIKRPWYCATQQGARHPRWKPHGLVLAYQAVNKTRWDTAVEPGAPFPFPHSPALQKQIRRKRKSVQPVFPLPSPRCYTNPPFLSPSLSPPPPSLSLPVCPVHIHARALKSYWQFLNFYVSMETILRLKYLWWQLSAHICLRSQSTRPRHIYQPQTLQPKLNTWYYKAYMLMWTGLRGQRA